MDWYRSQAGTSAVEYGLFLALVAAAIFATVVTLGEQVLELYRTVEGEF